MERVENIILNDGRKYSGYGSIHNGIFLPNGYGIKYYSEMYVKGNFVNGELNGPAIISHDYYMHTMQMKQNRGNGWGLMINRGVLAQFGYYENSKLKDDYLKIVDWYYDKLVASERGDENMLHIYTSKLDGHLMELHIGYPETKKINGVGLCCMGFHFLDDDSVWIGNTDSRIMSGLLIKFCPDGSIQSGQFENGKLLEEMDIQEVKDTYSCI